MRSKRMQENKSLKDLKKLKDNKAIRIIYNIFYWVLVIFTVAVLAVVLLQRFSDNSISLGGFRVFNVITESMEPKYVVGDVLLAKEKDTDEIEVGEDVVYKGVKGEFADRIVTHQVIEIEEKDGARIFHTKGIANLEEDPEITGDQIMGVITYKIRSLGLVAKIINNLYSFYFIIFIPFGILVVIEIRKMVISFREKRKDKHGNEEENEYDEDEDYDEDDEEEEKGKNNKD